LGVWLFLAHAQDIAVEEVNTGQGSVHKAINLTYSWFKPSSEIKGGAILQNQRRGALRRLPD
jgi:hypothetical protein